MEWIEYWTKGCFYILALCIGPTVAKELSRPPMPQEGKPNESRPLSLVHDVWGFTNGIAHRTFSAAVEKSGILDKDVMAYRKGRSAEDIATCIVLMHKEAN